MSDVGKLVSVIGTVTSTSEVRPELISGRFVCGDCQVISSPVEQQFKYTEPTICMTRDCTNRSKSWKLDPMYSKFGDWQRVRVQENANNIPSGKFFFSLYFIFRRCYA
jgi:DNA replication licensing factor MCM6